MKSFNVNQNAWLVVLAKNEELVESLSSFLAQQQITSGWVQGLGGLKQASLGVYRLSSSKEYEFHELQGDLELVSLTGNVSKLKDGIKLHLHAVIGDEQLNTKGGHLKSAIVGGTVEILVSQFQANLVRQKDEDVGLDLISANE